MNLAQIVADLQAKRAEVQEEVHGLDAALRALKGLGSRKQTRSVRQGRRRLSAAARKRISDAQKARWAKYKRKRRAA